MIFQWEFYVNKYKDLHNITTMEEAWNHWTNHGKKEERIYADVSIFFDWKTYVSKNIDLSTITTEEDAWKHFLYHSHKENRDVQNKKILKKYCV